MHSWEIFSLCPGQGEALPSLPLYVISAFLHILLFPSFAQKYRSTCSSATHGLKWPAPAPGPLLHITFLGKSLLSGANEQTNKKSVSFCKFLDWDASLVCLVELLEKAYLAPFQVERIVAGGWRKDNTLGERWQAWGAWALNTTPLAPSWKWEESNHNRATLIPAPTGEQWAGAPSTQQCSYGQSRSTWQNKGRCQDPSTGDAKARGLSAPEFSQLSNGNVTAGYLSWMPSLSSGVTLNVHVSQLLLHSVFQVPGGNSLSQPKCHHWSFRHFVMPIQMTIISWCKIVPSLSVLCESKFSFKTWRARNRNFMEEK